MNISIEEKIIDLENGLVAARGEREGVGGIGSLGLTGANYWSWNGCTMRSCCVVVSHGRFGLHFSNNQGCWALLQVLVGHLCIFLGAMSLQDFCPFFHWVVGFSAVELHMLLVYPRYEALLHGIVWNYFLPLWKLSLCFLAGFLCCAKTCEFD